MNKLTLHHICIQTNCYNESLDFYCNILNMKIINETKDFHGRDYNTWLKAENFMVELQTGKSILKSIDKEHTGVSHICFYVEDIEAIYKEFLQKGVKTFIKHSDKVIYEVNNGKLLKMKAPEGTIIEFRNKLDC